MGSARNWAALTEAYLQAFIGSDTSNYRVLELVPSERVGLFIDDDGHFTAASQALAASTPTLSTFRGIGSTAAWIREITVQTALTTDWDIEDHVPLAGTVCSGGEYLRGRATIPLRQVAEHQLASRKSRDIFLGSRGVRKSTRATLLNLDPHEEDTRARREAQKAAAARIRAEAESSHDGDPVSGERLEPDLLEGDDARDDRGEEGRDDDEAANQGSA